MNRLLVPIAGVIALVIALTGCCAVPNQCRPARSSADLEVTPQ